jgi:nucleoside-diphosphate-sugar epimerase
MALHLVTGGAGFIGSSIAEALLTAGERVRVLDDFSSGRRANLEDLPGRVEVIEGTIVDPNIVAPAMAGVQTVFHEAAIPSVVRSVENPQATMLAGVQGTTVVLDMARHAGVRRVVFAASSSAYGDTPTLPKVETMPTQPLSPYAAAKLTGEQLMRIFAELYGIETVSLRYFNVFGPRQDPNSEYAAVIPKFITAAINKQRATVYGDGEQTRDFCYIENAVRANLLAAGTPRKLRGEVVNVACGERRDVRDSLADIRAARDLLGYEPTVDVRDGLQRTFSALQGINR